LFLWSCSLRFNQSKCIQQYFLYTYNLKYIYLYILKLSSKESMLGALFNWVLAIPAHTHTLMPLKSTHATCLQSTRVRQRVVNGIFVVNANPEVASHRYPYPHPSNDIQQLSNKDDEYEWLNLWLAANWVLKHFNCCLNERCCLSLSLCSPTLFSMQGEWKGINMLTLHSVS